MEDVKNCSAYLMREAAIDGRKSRRSRARASAISQTPSLSMQMPNHLARQLRCLALDPSDTMPLQRYTLLSSTGVSVRRWPVDSPNPGTGCGTGGSLRPGETAGWTMVSSSKR